MYRDRIATVYTRQPEQAHTAALPVRGVINRIQYTPASSRQDARSYSQSAQICGFDGFLNWQGEMSLKIDVHTNPILVEVFQIVCEACEAKYASMCM